MAARNAPPFRRYSKSLSSSSSMTPRVTRFWALLPLVASVVVSACHGHPAKRLVGDFQLMRFESGQSYYLCVRAACGGETTGVLDGEVFRLGWTEKILVVEMGGPPRPHGWRIVEIGSQRVEGPMTEGDFRRRLREIGLASLKIESPAEAWKRL